MTISREQIFQILSSAGATRTYSCCGIEDKLCSTDVWRGNMEAVVKIAYSAGQAAELKALREQEPVGVVDESDDGLFADLETPDGVVVKHGDKLYAHPVPARKVTDAIQAIGRRSTPMRADEGRSPLEFDNGWNQCLDAIERHLKGEGE